MRYTLSDTSEITISDVPGSTQFIRNLNPVEFSYNDSQWTPEKTIKEMSTESIVFEDGVYKKKTVSSSEFSVTYEEQDVYDSTGTYVLEKRWLPKMVPYTALHWGITAQSVESALGTGSNVKLLTSDSNGKQHLQYEEMIASLVKTIQELDTRILYLESIAHTPCV